MTSKISLVILTVCCFLQAAHSVHVRSHAGRPHVRTVAQQLRLLRDASIDNYITMVIENFAEAMKTGIPILGMPVLDPINITYIALPVITTPAFALNASVSDMSVSGTSSFSPTLVHVDLEKMSMDLNLHMKDVRVDGDYSCQGRMTILPVFGEGPFFVQVLSITTEGSGGILITDDDHLQISHLNLVIDFGILRMFLDNFLGGGSFGDEINEAMRTLVESIMRSVLPIIDNKILPLLVNVVNEALMKHTISEIIDGILPGKLLY